MDIREIEQRSLAPAKWVNLFMGVAGVTAAIAANATALMLDGLYSGVNFLAVIFAARVAKDIARPPDARRPFGYEINEPMYIMFRSLVLTGIIIMALFNALTKVVDYIRGAHVDEVVLGPVIGYAILMLALCFGLAAWHHKHWLMTGRQSDLLKAERQASLIDGAMSAAAGGAFVIIALLKHTPLAFLTPISDSIVVIGLTLYIVPQPIGMFFKAAGEVVAESVDEDTVEKLRKSIDDSVKDKPFELLEVSATKTGRTLFVLAYIRPEKASAVDKLDEVRDTVKTACEPVQKSVRTDVIFTARRPYSPGR